MKENFNCQRKNNVNLSVWYKYNLFLEGFIRSEYEKSILFKLGKIKVSYVPYQIRRIVADTKLSSINELQNRWNRFNNRFEFNETRIVP